MAASRSLAAVVFENVSAGGSIDVDVFITPAERPALFVGVPARPRLLVGRDQQIDQLTERLVSLAPVRIALDGLPGVGKTTLATALAYHRRLLEHFSDGVLWAHLGPRARPVRSLTAWADALEIDLSGLPSVEARCAAVREAIGQRRLLLVIDDAWQIDHALALDCGGPHCAIVLTTRNRSIAQQFADATQHEPLPPLDRAAATAFMRAMAHEVYDRAPAAVDALVQATGGLPMALHVLGAYLAAPGHRLTPRLSQRAIEQLADPLARLKLAQERVGTQGRQLTIAEIVGLSLDDLQTLADGDAAVNAFYALGRCAPKPARISWEAALAITEAGELALALLYERNLIDADDEGIALHQTIADVACTRTDAPAVARQRSYYLALATSTPDDWQRIEQNYVQIAWTWAGLPAGDPLTIAYAQALAGYQERRGLWHDQLDWALRAIPAARATGEPAVLGELYNSAGFACCELGQPHAALPYFQAALAERQRAGDPIDLANTLNNLGTAYDDLEEFDTALGYYQQALAIHEARDNQIDAALTRSNIATTYAQQGRYEQALAQYEQALREQQAAGDAIGSARTANNLGKLHFLLDQHEQALAHFEHALQLSQATGDRDTQAETLAGMAGVLNDLARSSDALPYLHQALTLRRGTNNQAALLPVLISAGRIQAASGQGDAAVQSYTEALALAEQLGDLEKRATILELLGETVDDLDAAIEYKWQAIQAWHQLAEGETPEQESSDGDTR